MQRHPPVTVEIPAYWTRWGGVVVLASGLMAAVYAVVQIAQVGVLRDAPLIVLVTVNTVFIYRFGIYLAPRVGALIAEFPAAGRDAQAAVNRFFGDPATAFPAVVYAGLIAFSVWRLDPWRDVAGLMPWLCAFIFVNNLIVGTVVIALVRFWRIMLSELTTLDIRILNLNRAPVIGLLRLNSQIVMATALVTCLSILGLVLSDYVIEPIIIFFSASALALVVATYAVPVLPLSNLLAARKTEELDRIERLIEARVRLLSGQPLRADLGMAEDALPPLEALTEARDLLLKIRTLPPGGQISVSAAAIVTFLSFIPTIIDYATRSLF
ncbi:hypothetical protein [uncultured Roseobacter sp.]|uniref:hypothetical protein n=1 Tax=uncultured Roseobacter sp. TaxID=114847 RepID=UPI002626DFA3|nr:hypothetical protein [uncultured Roseobacter sp.]